MPDAVVVGSGPNGLAAAVALAREGLHVVVFEAASQIGGAARSIELTEPGFVHDFGSAVFPLGIGSPFFRQLPLDRYGLEWIHPDIPVAHPLDDGRAAFLHRSLEDTAMGLGDDEASYRRFLEPLVRDWPRLEEELLQPLLHLPSHPIALARFGVRAIVPPLLLGKATFRTDAARALWAGIAAHSARPFTSPGGSAFGMLLAALGHHVGWPFPRGGAGAITQALAGYLESMGGEIVLDRRITALEELPRARAVLFDTTPHEMLRIAGDKMPGRYRRTLARFKYGMGSYKLDYALDGPIPWTNPEVGRAGTVHLGGTMEEIARAEADVARGKIPRRPYILLSQPAVSDPGRAPDGKHVLWAYCHVPNGSQADMREAMEAEIERHAPGFRKCIIARHTMGTLDMEVRNPNLVGGDVSGGRNDLWQVVARPQLHPDPYTTPVKGLYLCSASTPPGGGVHGMCGYNAALRVLRDLD